MVKKPKKVKVKKEKVPERTSEEVKEGQKETSKIMKEIIKEENIAAKAKRLSKSGLTVKEVAKELGINKYEASKLIKG